MTAMEGEAGTQRVHFIEPHHPPPQVHTVWCFPSRLYRGHSLHCKHPTLRSRVELFNENRHAISIHGPRKKSMIRTERVSAVTSLLRGCSVDARKRFVKDLSRFQSASVDGPYVGGFVFNSIWSGTSLCS